MHHYVMIYKVIEDGLIYDKETIICTGLYDYNSLYDIRIKETN
jgi:hypothetical protein